MPLTPNSNVSSFTDLSAIPEIHGFLHEASHPTGNTLVLTHGAGTNCQARLLVEISEAFAASGFTVLRFDLPFRRDRPQGPPFPAVAAKDRDGLRRAVTLMKAKTRGRIFLGGHSYGGRQASILLSEEPDIVDAVLLLSYPLHPPRKPTELRTQHFPKLRTPALFVHGTRDPFATPDEMKSALELIPAPHAIYEIESAGHDLLGKKSSGATGIPSQIASKFKAFLEPQSK
ncbi:MAG TPA: alpha/beta fold hydrolase [Candidatus Acidoferrum sp.]|nr:alpha/beta fold hydrolase [Candidatus Acidoferrum sp.]